jgi:hypothetical protein
MVEQPAGVYQIVLRVRQRFGGDVMTPDFEVWFVDLLQKAGVKVCGGDVTGRADLAAQPVDHGPTAAAHFQTPPPGSHPQRRQPLEGQGIELLFKESQPAAGLLPRIV